MISKVFFASCVAAVAANKVTERQTALAGLAKDVDTALTSLKAVSNLKLPTEDKTNADAFNKKFAATKSFVNISADAQFKITVTPTEKTFAKAFNAVKAEITAEGGKIDNSKDFIKAASALQKSLVAASFKTETYTANKKAVDDVHAAAAKLVAQSAAKENTEDGCCTLQCFACWCGIPTLVLGATGAGLYFFGVLDDMLAAMGFDTEKACEDGGACKDVTDKAQDAFSGEENAEENTEESTEESGSGCACFLIIFALLAVAALAYYFMAGSNDEENTTEEESDDQ